jgi:hypothetical protein
MREEGQMVHYDIGEWADYVRNLLSGARRSDLDQHLAGGCEECGAVVGFLRDVANTAAADGFYQHASAGPAAGAREIFSGYPRNVERPGVLDTLRALVAQLTFDSASQLYPSGARGDRTTTRQLMYQAGGYCVDLRVDRERNTTRVILVGQVANQDQPLLQLARLPIFVMAGKKIISETASNEFGEFTLEFPPRENLRLCVQVTQAGFQLEVPLKRTLEEA